ncbi:MAG: hypothetical protein AAGE65_05375 [Planctomycetota bacterium]
MLLLLFGAAVSGGAQSARPIEPSAVPGDPQPATAQSVDEASSEEATRASMLRDGDRQTIDALPRPWVRGLDSRVGMPAASVDLDPTVIGLPPGSDPPELYREGDFVVDRLGRLRTLPNGATAFVFVQQASPESGEEADPDAAAVIEGPGARAMILQPCQRLETMLSAAEQQDDRDALFRLTGQVHVYRGVNYLLPTELTGYQVEPDRAPLPAPNEPVQAADLPDAAADLDAPPPVTVGSEPTMATNDAQRLMDAMADELDALAQENPSRGGSYGGISAPLDPGRVRTAQASPPGAAVNPGTAGTASGELVREGEFVLNRVGRVVRSSDRREVLFAFEADGPGLAEAPMGILPSRLRTFMEDAVATRGDSAVFVVSGRVTQFRGANYLLPVSAKLRIDQDALGG